MPNLSPAERRRLEQLMAALGEFRKLDPDMQMPMATTLLLVALNDGIGRSDVVKTLNVAGSTASRNLTGLMRQGRLGRPGHGLIVQRVHPDERRRRMHSLTPEGWRVVRRLIDEMGDPAEAPGAERGCG